MPHDSIQISSSEAFLLGLVLGEWDTVGFDDFNDLLLERLGPFFPDLKKHHHDFLEELPADASPVESSIANGDFFKSPSYQTIMKLENGGYLAIQVDDLGNSLLDLISERMKAFRWDRWNQRVADADPSDPCHRDGARDAAIADSLRLLALENGCEQQLNSGRLFGKFFGLIRKAQIDIEHLELEIEAEHLYPSTDVPTTPKFESERGLLLRTLRDDPSVKECDPAFDAIESEIDRWNREFKEIATSPILKDEVKYPYNFDVMTEMNYLLQTYWLTIGIMFRHLRDADTLKPQPRLPRKFVVIKADKVQALRFAILTAQNELHAPSSRFTPAEIVKPLVEGIEPLARDLANQRMMNNYADDVFRLLRKDTDGKARHFADIADHLHSTYRNRLSHDGPLPNDPIQSMSEALFVYSGCKLLMELYDDLKRRKPKN